MLQKDTETFFSFSGFVSVKYLSFSRCANIFIDPAHNSLY